jgi:hypothetical protein
MLILFKKNLFVCSTIILVFFTGCHFNATGKSRLQAGGDLTREALLKIDALYKFHAPSIIEFETNLYGFKRIDCATLKMVNNFETLDGYQIILDPDLSQVSKAIHELATGRSNENSSPFDKQIKVRSCVFMDSKGNQIASRSWEEFLP